MAETVTSVSERVDALPVLWAHLDRMGLQPLLDAQFPTHGHWVGLSLGWVSGLWLTPILAEGDHRRNHVAPWAKPRLPTLQACPGPPVHPLDGGDDRRATVLEALRDEARWRAWEGALNQHARRVYDLPPTGVHLDRTSASGYGSVTEAGLWQVGHRPDHRPDRPQGTIMVAALDPLGMPVATASVPGQRADAPLSIPAITRVREGLGRRGRLSVGDGTMGAWETRASLHAGGDDDLWPLSETHVPPAVVADDLAPVWTAAQALPRLHRAQPKGPSQLIAAGFERLAPVTAEVAGQPYRWRERRWVIRSCRWAPAAERGRRGRLAQAQAEITALPRRGRGRPRRPDPRALRAAVEALLARSRVHGRLHGRDQEHWWAHPVRRYGGRNATVRLEGDVQVPVSLAQEAGAAAVRQLGWRVYVTTPPPAPLSRPEAVRVYRHAYLVERAMGRLKGRPLSLPPMSREREDQATGLIRLWSLGLRVLTRWECAGRRRLATAQTTLAGWSVGHPTRAPAHPTAARLLEPVQGLTLTIIRDGRRRRRHLTPLARVQQRILALLDVPVAIDTRLCPDSHKPP